MTRQLISASTQLWTRSWRPASMHMQPRELMQCLLHASPCSCWGLPEAHHSFCLQGLPAPSLSPHALNAWEVGPSPCQQLLGLVQSICPQ